MTYFYTARAKFDKGNGGDILAWANYIQWSNLTQLTELVSIDTSLNEVLVEPDHTSEEINPPTDEVSFQTSTITNICHSKNQVSP
jgi:hypothetical protein